MGGILTKLLWNNSSILRPPCPLESLPNELLLDIATYMSDRDACNLSLVSRKLATIAQEQLHHAPAIFTDGKSASRSRIALLARTMMSRPNLAQKVRLLHLRPSTDFVDVETANYLIPHSEVIDEVRQCSAPPKRETKIVGDILHCVTYVLYLNVRTIRRTNYLNDPDYNEEKDCMTELLFGQNCQYGPDMQPQISHISGLQHLRVVSLGGSRVHRAWCELPQLWSVQIGGTAKLISPPENSQIPQLRVLRLGLNTKMLCRCIHEDNSVGKFLENLSMLASIKVSLCDLDIEDTEEDDGFEPPHLTSSHRGSFDGLIHNLEPVQSTLTELVIQECNSVLHDHTEAATFLPFVSPITTLVPFKRLIYLEVPYEALVGTERRSVTQLLPESLVLLKIHAPRAKSILPFLKEISQAPKYFTCLRGIILVTYAARGDSFEEFLRHRYVWKRLSEAQIQIRLRCGDEDGRAEWLDQKDYDPFLCAIVEYLDSLT